MCIAKDSKCYQAWTAIQFLLISQEYSCIRNTDLHEFNTEMNYLPLQRHWFENRCGVYEVSNTSVLMLYIQIPVLPTAFRSALSNKDQVQVWTAPTLTRLNKRLQVKLWIQVPCISGNKESTFLLVTWWDVYKNRTEVVQSTPSSVQVKGQKGGNKQTQKQLSTQNPQPEGERRPGHCRLWIISSLAMRCVVLLTRDMRELSLWDQSFSRSLGSLGLWKLMIPARRSTLA